MDQSRPGAALSPPAGDSLPRGGMAVPSQPVPDREHAGDGDLLMRTAMPLIIEPSAPPMSPGALARNLVTLACWTVWVHFLMPLLTLLAWMTGWHRLTTELLAPEGLGLMVRYLPVYLAVLAALCGSLIAWALFNWWRFSDRERRRASPGVTTEQVAAAMGLDAEGLKHWQRARRLVVRHDEQGRPCGVDEADTF
jgi:biofilm PGA synthesis protein PgaD